MPALTGAEADLSNVLRERAGICHPHLSQWHFIDSIDSTKPHLYAACASQLGLLRQMRDIWRTETFQIPEAWMPEPLKIGLEENVTDNLAAWELKSWLEVISDKVTYLSNQEVVRRHFNPTSSEPDFLLWGLRRHDWYMDADMEDSFYCDPRVSIVPFKNVITYGGLEDCAASVVPAMFSTIPGCWLRCDPEFDFDDKIADEDLLPPVDFAGLRHPIGPSGPAGVERDHNLCISLLHPAVVVGAKGPARWPHNVEPPCERSAGLQGMLHAVALSVHPSLSSHLLHWYLHCEQSTESTYLEETFRRLPDCMFLFGVMYDAECIRLVAHIPFIDGANARDAVHQWSYLSCVVDVLPFGPMPRTTPDLQAFCEGRFRVALALLTVRRHAFRLSSLCDGVIWPAAIALSEAKWESRYLGPTPTPSDNGSYDLLDPDDDYYETPATPEDAELFELQMQTVGEKARSRRPVVEKWVADIQEAMSDIDVTL